MVAQTPRRLQVLEARWKEAHDTHIALIRAGEDWYPAFLKTLALARQIDLLTDSLEAARVRKEQRRIERQARKRTLKSEAK